MSVNNILYKSQQYNGLLNLMGSKRSAGANNGLLSNQSLSGLGTSGLDTVQMALSGVSQRIMSDMATETKEYLAGHKELADDYVMAIIDDPNGEKREVRIYRRSELVEAQGETEAQKKELDEFYKKSPVLNYTSADKLPKGMGEMDKDDEAAQGLAKKLTDFLTKNKKTINILVREGFSPFGSVAKS